VYANTVGGQNVFCETELENCVVETKEDSDESSIYFGLYSSEILPSKDDHGSKRQKQKHKTTEVVGEVLGTVKPGIVRILLDTGASATIILKDAIRGLTGPVFKTSHTRWHTMGGQFVTKLQREIKFKLPEFSTSKIVQWVCHEDTHTLRKNAQYDMIIGADLLSELGIEINFNTQRIVWEGVEIPMKEKNVISDLQNATAIYYHSIEPTVLKEAEARQKRILDADYSALDLDDYAHMDTHLSNDQQEQLVRSLRKYPKLFRGGLGVLNVPPVHLELRPLSKDEKPYHARPFPVPKCYEETTKKEIKRLCDIGVLTKCNDSEWAAPTFIQPKKTGDVRVLTDFRVLNRYIKRKPYPLPKIADLLQKLEGFNWATALDLSMGYYHIVLDKESSYLCTMIVPWGKYRYCRLPMGLNGSPDIFQAIINDIMGDLPNVRAYLDDILVTTAGSYEDHLQHVELVLQRLTEVGFAVNLRKSSFAVTEIDYLGYWITRHGIQPQPKKVEAIMRLTPPTTKRQLRRFLGMINYYRDMWRRRSHILAPLTALCSAKAKFIWHDKEQKAFEDIKAIISRETLLAYPDFSKDFHIYTDSSDYQLGAVIMQNDRPLAFYSRKLNSAQKRYTTGEQELLSIVETLKEFKNILLGQKLIVHTDHKNLLYQKMSSDRIIRWRLLIEEFGPTFLHIKGEKNVIADALSRLDANFNEKLPTEPTNDTMAYIFMTKTDVKETDFPLSPTLIAKYQRLDNELKRRSTRSKSQNFNTKTIEGVEVITYQGKIYIPIQLQQRVVAWYHEYLAHPGESRTEATIRQTCTWPKLRSHVETFCKTCRTCQLFKKQRKKYGHLPPKEAEELPWSRVNVDLIGPYVVRTPTSTHTLRALTMIDPVTGWFEVISIPDKNAHTVMEAFNNTWLTRYPRPQYIGYDNGSEFKAQFKQMCENYGMKEKPSSSYNPQSNGIVERVHQVLGNALRTFELEQKELDTNDPWGPFLSAAAWAIRSTVHTTLDATPGQLVFGRDMLLPIQLKTDWARIRQRKQDIINANNKKENAKRIEHEYRVGEKVLLEKPGLISKLSAPRTGPYRITETYANGTVRIQRGIVNERVNIRRLTPYKERVPPN
jgi:transposase InsO family protein